MKILKTNFLLLAVLIVINGACVPKETKRDVQSNVFSSSNNPTITIKIDPNIEYIGVSSTAEEKQSVERTSSQKIKNDMYIFGQVDKDNRVKKMVIIGFRTLTERGRGTWLPDMHSDMTYKLYSSRSTKINGKYYQISVKAFTQIDKDLSLFCQERGITLSNRYLVKITSRIVSNDSTVAMHILYAEDIFFDKDVGKYEITEWQSSKTLSDEQKTFLNKFLERSEDSFQVLNEGT